MSNDHVHPFFSGLLDDVTRQAKQHLRGQGVIARKRIHPDDAREAFGVLVLHFGGATADTREAVQLYRRLESAWDRAVLALGAAQERRDRLEAEQSLDRQYAYEQYRKAKDADEFERTAPTAQQREEQQRLADEEAEREERRQVREWRNDSGV